jgi:ATP-dependent DNA helicase RecG
MRVGKNNLWSSFIDQAGLKELMGYEENLNLEFKEAKSSFDKDKLIKYCIALANEKGGYLILGVSDKIPRQVVGTSLFENLVNIQREIFDSIHLKIVIQEIEVEGKRVLVFQVPSRPPATPLTYAGGYWMRVGESLTSMSPEMLRQILNETNLDYSANICHGLEISELSQKAVENLRKLVSRKLNNSEIMIISIEQLLADLELSIEGELNYAALVLLGSNKAISRYQPQVEIIFEYRNDPSNIESQQRKEFRTGFLEIFDEIWNLIDIRNEVVHFQDGIFIKDIPMFNEEVIRESLLNAVCHRDYTFPGSIFIRQYPKEIVFESPGPFPKGVTEENILDKQVPRNRRLAEVFQKCGLVERSGQGVDKIFNRSIQESKPLPDYSQSDETSVILRLEGTVQDIEFIKFLESISDQIKTLFSTKELFVLEIIRSRRTIKPDHIKSIHRLVNLGIVDSYQRGRGTKYLISSKYYKSVGKQGVQTRLLGLSTSEKQVLILKHLEKYRQGTYEEFSQIFPSLSRYQINGILKVLKKQNKIEHKGSKREGFWVLKH